MIEKITELLVHYSVPPSIASPAGYVLALGCVVLVSFVVDFLTRRVLLRLIAALAKRSKTTFDDAVISNKVPEKFAHIAPAIVFYLSKTAPRTNLTPQNSLHFSLRMCRTLL
ncbi:MAG: hypothetical protein KDD70_15480 [Bdellovibrionales bacterium]|nr:hypothetical protein [Bdellovibrionales bacterium]